MRISQILAVVSIALSGASFAADKHDHAHEPKALNGGIVAEANDLDFELVAKPDSISLYVRNHGKPTNTQGATAKLTLLNGAEKTEVTLAPNGANAFEAKGVFVVQKGTKALALVSMPDKKSSTIRFQIR